jgi:hypothetical protein
MLKKAIVILVIMIVIAVVVVVAAVVGDWCSSVFADAMVIEIASFCVSAVVVASAYRVDELFDTPSEISRFSTLINSFLKSFIFKKKNNR